MALSMCAASAFAATSRIDKTSRKLPTASFAVRRYIDGSPVGINLIDQVESVAASQFSSTFSSAMATDDETEITVFLTQLTPSTESAIASMAASGIINFELAPWNKTQILATQSEVVSDWSYLVGQGIDVISIFPSINGDALVHIGVENLTAAQTQVLRGCANRPINHLRSGPLIA